MGVARQVEAVVLIESATKEIAKFIDPNDFEVISFKEGVLKVYASSSSAANSLNLAWPKIKKPLEEEGFRITRIIITSRSNLRPQ